MKYWFLIITCVWCAATVAREEGVNSAVVLSLLTTIEEKYVLTDHTSQIKQALLDYQNSEAFDAIKTPNDLASQLTRELNTFDKHFTVQFVSDTNQSAPQQESWFKRLNRNNSGFNKVEVLEGNIGYIDFWGFASLNEASKATVSSALTFLSNTDALILDLRNNGGGSAEMVQYLSSHFFAKKTHLNSFYTRQTDSTSEFWTFENVETVFPAPFPVYILISNNTFSAAEEFAYNFKHLGRATLVGQPSKGGANPWQWFDIEHGYRAGIPVAMAINPITKTNWEGVGVIPHVSVNSENALNKAYFMALQNIRNNVNNEFQRNEIKRKLAELMKEESSLFPTSSL